jgi:tRNA-Thr(GGU) m(6)t(6)A37 methyltransferase TsaA
LTYRFEPIAILRSPFKEKFGIPRQPGLVPDVPATLEFLPPYDRDEAVDGLDAFSHLWLLFVFHQHVDEGWKATVRPPRLGGNRRVGVFASRAPYRPNPIGLSVVELVDIRRQHGTLSLGLRGADLMDGTPVLDIKPYLPYADAPRKPRAGFAPQPPEAKMAVEFTPQAASELSRRGARLAVRLEPLVVQLLQTDPRPAYLDDDTGRQFGMRLFDFDLRWRIRDGRVIVTGLRDVES